ncbi:hypothetical protein BJX70DRAFT_393499 [Aspergillus crustosus]
MPQIPVFYRAVLLWYDPIGALFGCYMNLFAKDTYLNSYIPPSLATRDPSHNMIFNQLAAGFFVVATSQAILLRYTSDVNVWKILNGCLLGWDFILLWSLWNGLGVQGRLGPGSWRGEDLMAIMPTVFMTLVRGAIVAGIGLNEEKKLKE